MGKEIENKYRPIPFWSWNDELDEEECVRQIDWMHEQGIGGFFMHARGGLTTPYLGEKWFKCVEACEKRAKELGMEAYAYDENGWPSGFVGGKLLEDDANKDAYLSFNYGPFDINAYASYDVSGDKLIRTNKGENNLNVYMTLSTSTVDICNKDVVRKFINLTHEEYKKHDIYGNLRGFFTDEPQYFRWGTAWTRVMPKAFKEEYGEDILDRLGLLFVEKEGYRDFRYKYWKLMQKLMLNAFGKQIYDWCSDNNYKLTGHYVEETTLGYQIVCCGGVMPFYEYEHIPGIDWLGRNTGDNALSAKQLGSVAAQTGKEQTMCEMFACAGWDATPQELKSIAECLMVDGVDIICHHLLPYSEHGQRKYDYPEHYSKINPWVSEGFKTFNDYFSELGKLLSTSKENVNVGLFCPIRSAYFNFKRDDEAHDFGCADITISMFDALNAFSDKQIPYHLLDETIMAKHAHVDGKKFVVGKCSYDFVVFPKLVYTMDKTTEALLKQFVANGGKILLLGDAPTYLEGTPHVYDFLKSNTSFEEILEAQDFVTNHVEKILLSYRTDSDGKPYVYVVNRGDERDLEIRHKEYKGLISNDELLGTKVHFNKFESKVMYFTNELPKPKPTLEQIKLEDTYNIVKPVDNYLTLDYMSYSKDGTTYTNQQHFMSIFYNLSKENYRGDLYLKYSFKVKDVPSQCVALIEDMHNKEVTINGVVTPKNGTVLEKDLWVYDIAKYIRVGHNEVVVKINFFQSDHVHYVLFGKNVLESLKNCLAYDTTIEPIYLRGNFGITGNFMLGTVANVILGEDFKMIKQPTSVSSFIEGGFPFLRGKISLQQTIKVDNTNKELVFDKRFQMIDLKVNGKFVKRMMFDYKVDLSKYLVKGENDIQLDLIISNRNLLGPFHTKEQEPLGIGPFTFERFGTWDKDGNSPLCIPAYAFVETII